jgi:hypothetical protein
MKSIFFMLCLLTAIAGAKTLQTAFPAETLVDGVVDFKQDNLAKMTLMGPSAKTFFEKLSDTRVTSMQPTVECLKVTIKSGDNIECGHCVERTKKKGGPEYWCDMNFDMQFGKSLGNPTFFPQALNK